MARSAIAALLALALAGCEEEIPLNHRVVGGDPERGKVALAYYGCHVCHTVPRASRSYGPAGTVGPSLEQFGRRAYIAGTFPNQPAFLVPWIMDAPGMEPTTAMPDMGVSQAEARDIAAFLYTLR